MKRLFTTTCVLGLALLLPASGALADTTRASWEDDRELVGKNSYQDTATLAQEANPPQATQPKKVKTTRGSIVAPKRGWVSTEKAHYFYRNGKKLKGLRKIGSKTYYFDSRGIQRTGWRRIGTAYRYFARGEKSRGYMLEKDIVDGVEINKKGKAVLNTESYEELNVLVKTDKLIDKLTNPRDNREVKLEKCWNYLIDRDLVPYRNYRELIDLDAQHRAYALDVFSKKKGDCVSYAFALAYIAKALGYEQAGVEDNYGLGTHCWATIDGKIYDPHHGTRDLAYGNFWAMPKDNGNPVFTTVHSYEVAANDKVWEGDAVKLKANPGKKAGWDKTKKRYYTKSGVCAVGTVVIKGKLYAFSNSGVLKKALTEQLQEAAADGDLAALAELLGERVGTLYTPSCLTDGGEDGIWDYGTLQVFTYREVDGTERFMGVE